MPFALVTIGLVLVITGVRDTYAALGSQVKADFTGQGNFTYWVVALGLVGSVGYVDKLRGFSNMFMALIIIAMVLKNGGVFSQFTQALKSGPVSPQAQAAPSQSSSVPGSSTDTGTGTTQQSSSGISAGDVAQIAGTAAMFLA